jgi:hypothetical protein
MRKVGTLNPVVYFENNVGHIILPGSRDDVNIGWKGYVRMEAETLPQIDRLAQRIDDQERRLLQSQLEHDEAVFSYRRGKTRESLLRTMSSGRTSEYEKDFIREYLKVSDERKRQLYSGHKRMQSFFEAREFDGSRGLVND